MFVRRKLCAFDEYVYRILVNFVLLLILNRFLIFAVTPWYNVILKLLLLLLLFGVLLKLIFIFILLAVFSQFSQTTVRGSRFIVRDVVCFVCGSFRQCLSIPLTQTSRLHNLGQGGTDTAGYKPAIGNTEPSSGGQ